MSHSLSTQTIQPEVLPKLDNGSISIYADRERVLLVDDSPTVRRMFRSFLTPRFDCVEAGSFDSAVAELQMGDYAVVVTDIIMPGLSGIELLRRILKDFPNTEVIVASGVDRPQRALDAIRLGAFDYLIKPCDPAVLEITVERAIDRRNLLVKALKNKLELETKNAELVASKAQLSLVQAQLVQTAKMASLGQLAAGVAHELNNPVGFVHANLEMLSQYTERLVRLIEFYERTDMPAAAISEAENIKIQLGYPAIVGDLNSIVTDCREGADRIRGIVENLRTFSRLDEADYKPYLIHEGIDATLRLLSQYFVSGQIELVREYGDLPSIEAFAGKLNQVWMNLLVNAAQAIGPGKGKVIVRTSTDDDNIFVDVSDTGCGIAVQYLERIFDPFYTTKPVGAGTGLGLSISFGIVERHGGNISVDTGLGKGTTFKVRLPKHFEPAAELAEKGIEFYAGI